MKVFHLFAATSICVAMNSIAQTNVSSKPAPSDEEVARMLKPSDDRRNPWRFKPFESNTEVPALTVQNLPITQMAFRINALKAVNKNIQAGAYAALESYSTKDVSDLGWKRIVVPREQSLFGDSVSVVLLRVDDNKKLVEIAVRGTENLDDALQDLKAKADYDNDLGFRIHSGFRTLARGILEHLKKHSLTDEILRTYTFHLYGHSLGGAVASILSMYLHEGGSQVAAVVTFGAPRFTTNEGTRKYQVLNQVTHRIVRCDDVIPFMPPPNFFGWTNESYQANGNIFLLLSPPYFDYSIGIDIERDFAYQLRLELENKGATNMLALGHRMDHYFSRLIHFMPSGLIANPKNEPGQSGYTGVPELQPVTYTLALQSKLCPAQTVSAR